MYFAWIQKSVVYFSAATRHVYFMYNYNAVVRMHACSNISLVPRPTPYLSMLHAEKVGACNIKKLGGWAWVRGYSNIVLLFHRDVGKAIIDCEHYLMYLNTLQPWFLRLNQAFNPDSIMKLFPPTIKTLLLVWQHSRCGCEIF